MEANTNAGWTTEGRPALFGTPHHAAGRAARVQPTKAERAG
jgi:hypothetical protein